ncbi:hypothetical protein [Streptomyces sp. L2]|uniref:hypothetical protein n=1 Tax=Streptomyces sp. L2 TaxID=2162665 RepID=UPI001F50FF73|nr:hypothetical protein [Streptomyces sp. L2]
MNEFPNQRPAEPDPLTEAPVALVPVTDPAPPTEAPVVSDPAPAPARPRRRLGRRLGRVLTGLVVVAAVLGGAGYTAVTVEHADRDPGKPVWKFPAAQKDPGEKAAKGLRAMLLPYADGPLKFHRGPDIAEFGSDAELSGRQATALRKQSIHDLPPQTRRKLEDLIDKEHIKGMAMRSYASDDASYGGVTVSFELVEMDQGSARTLARSQRAVFTALKIFRKGPKIKGHQNTACFLPPKDHDEKIGRMVCFGYEGDVLVTADVSGRSPVDTHALAGFIGRQLDRIKDPGKAV